MLLEYFRIFPSSCHVKQTIFALPSFYLLKENNTKCFSGEKQGGARPCSLFKISFWLFFIFTFCFFCFLFSPFLFLVNIFFLFLSIFPSTFSHFPSSFSILDSPSFQFFLFFHFSCLLFFLFRHLVQYNDFQVWL